MKIRILEDVDGHYMKVFGVPGYGTRACYFSTMFDMKLKQDLIRAMFLHSDIHYFARIDHKLVSQGVSYA